MESLHTFWRTLFLFIWSLVLYSSPINSGDFVLLACVSHWAGLKNTPENLYFQTAPTGCQTFCVVTGDLKKLKWPGKSTGLTWCRWRFHFLNSLPLNTFIRRYFSYSSPIFKIYYRINTLASYWRKTWTKCKF